MLQIKDEWGCELGYKVWQRLDASLVFLVWGSLILQDMKNIVLTSVIIGWGKVYVTKLGSPASDSITHIAKKKLELGIRNGV